MAFGTPPTAMTTAPRLDTCWVMKKGSKRVTLKHKYSVIKRVKAHRKKLKKLAKKAGLLHTRKEKPIELTIPKSWIHKEAILEEVLAQRQDEEGRRSKYRGELKALKKANKSARKGGKSKRAGGDPDSDEEI